LNVGYVPNFNFELLPQTLGSFREVCPQITFNLFEMIPADQSQALEEHKIDLGFVGFRPRVSPKELQWECVCQQEVSAALSARHPLAKKRSVKLADLKGVFFVGMSETKYPGYREWLNDTCRSASFSPRVLQEADFEAGLLAFVAENLGVALVREQISKRPSAGVAFRPLQPRLHSDYWVAWHRNNTSPGRQRYIEIIKKAAAR
jgi:DNA-binding transcriptional LysR family regulator